MAEHSKSPRKPRPGQSLAERFPEVAALADGWDPAEVSAFSSALRSWKCPKGHSWTGSVAGRATVGPGCPICSNQTVLVGYNDLATTRPDLAAQADGWDPTTVVAGTNKRLQWKCAHGHTWVASGSDRYSGKGCPYCSGNRVWPGFNDLATTQPAIAAEAHEWDPTTVTSRSGFHRMWKCPRGHIYDARVADRTAGSGCPYCSNQRVLPGGNDLATTHPAIAAQAHGWDPTSVVSGGKTLKEWECDSGHIFKQRISHRINGIGCPYCSNKAVLVGYNDLATTHPELASEAVGDDAKTVTAGSGKKIRWRCNEGHEYRVAPSSRRNGEGCPYCSKHQALPGYNDLATNNPELAAQAYGWDPTTVVAGSGRRLPWQCEQGHIWTAVVGQRQLGYGCRVCSGLDALPGYNDLATTHPDLAAQADGWDPTTVTARSGLKKTWRCANAHTWSVKINVRVAGKGCPYCASIYVWPGYNDLATTRPHLAAQAHGWDPTTVTRGSKQTVEWKCELGHLYIATVGARDRGSGCPYCAGQKVIPGFNDFATIHPELAVEADGWDPTTVPQWSVQMKNWICPEGHRYRAAIGNRSLGRGCPTCAKSGFDPNKTGYLYFLHHDIWDMFQVGITNVPDKRLAAHRRLGWTELEVRGPLDGYLTRDLETSILRSLRARGAIFANKTDCERFDGWSESWLAVTLHVASMKELLDYVYEDD